jgi:NAD(P)-dependent dehydrogenase (short-subunit alcohol dehydrogenase family)
MEPAGRHALVTGGGRGIGAAITRTLTDAGATVTVLGRTPGPLQEMTAKGEAAGWELADVTNTEALALAVERAESARGPVAILINNAGGAESAPFARTDRGLWDRMLALNLSAVFESTKLVMPGMIARKFGRVVNIASTAGLTGYAYVSAYVAAKHGVVGLTRALALEAAKTGVTVNAVCPGFTETDMLGQSIATAAEKTGRTMTELRESFVRFNPQGRLVRPEEVAAAVLFLCGPCSGAMTGQAIAVSGGEVM